MSEPALSSGSPGDAVTSSEQSVIASWVEARKARELLAATALRTLECDIAIWGFGVGLALTGLVAAGQILERTDLIEHVARLVEPSGGAKADVTDHLVSLEALAALSGAREGIDVEALVRRFASAVRDAYRPVPGRPAVHRPDLPLWSSIVWVDCMHTVGPGLGLAGDADAGLDAMIDAASVLQDPCGLFCHGYDVTTGLTNGVHWGRGQGWALHGLVATAAACGRNSSHCERAERLLTALGRHEESGRWRTVVDRDGSPFENSTSALVASGVSLGLQSGSIDASWSELGRRAMCAVVDDLAESDGALVVSAATPVGAQEAYDQQPTGVFPWGQGPALCSLAMALGWQMPGISKPWRQA